MRLRPKPAQLSELALLFKAFPDAKYSDLVARTGFSYVSIIRARTLWKDSSELWRRCLNGELTLAVASKIRQNPQYGIHSRNGSKPTKLTKPHKPIHSHGPLSKTQLRALEKYSQRLELTTLKAAELAGVSESSVSYFRRVQWIRPDLIPKILAGKLGIQKAWLIANKPAPAPTKRVARITPAEPSTQKADNPILDSHILSPAQQAFAREYPEDWARVLDGAVWWKAYFLHAQELLEDKSLWADLAREAEQHPDSIYKLAYIRAKRPGFFTLLLHEDFGLGDMYERTRGSVDEERANQNKQETE